MPQSNIERAPLDERLDALALQFQQRAWDDPKAANSGYLQDHAQSLAEFANQLRDEYVRIVGDDEIPTVAQGVALARFLRPQFRDDVRPGNRSAHITRAGAGLPNDYLHVILPGGYEGGIAPDGRVST